MTGLLPNAQQQFLDANGQPLSGGTVYMFEPGTTTPKATYQDSALSVPNSHPIILNSAGRATIWGNGSFRQVVYDQNDQIVWDANTSA